MTVFTLDDTQAAGEYVLGNAMDAVSGTAGYLGDAISGTGQTIGDTLGGLIGGLTAPFRRTLLMLLGLGLAAWVLASAL